MRFNNSCISISWIKASIDEYLDLSHSLKNSVAMAAFSVRRFYVVYGQQFVALSRRNIRSQRLQKVQTLLPDGELLASAASIGGFYDHSQSCRYPPHIRAMPSSLGCLDPLATRVVRTLLALTHAELALTGVMQRVQRKGG